MARHLSRGILKGSVVLVGYVIFEVRSAIQLRMERQNVSSKRSSRIRKADSAPSKLYSTVMQFLQRNRATPHTATGRTPSELIFGRTIRTSLNLLHPSVEGQVGKAQLRQLAEHSEHHEEFVVGQPVFARQYGGAKKWSPGKIARRTGPGSYDVLAGSEILHRHIISCFRT